MKLYFTHPQVLKHFIKLWLKRLLVNATLAYNLILALLFFIN